MGDALAAEQRANEELRAREAAARDEAAKPGRLAEATAKLERHIAIARILVERLGFTRVLTPPFVEPVSV